MSTVVTQIDHLIQHNPYLAVSLVLNALLLIVLFWARIRIWFLRRTLRRLKSSSRPTAHPQLGATHQAVAAWLSQSRTQIRARANALLSSLLPKNS